MLKIENMTIEKHQEILLFLVIFGFCYGCVSFFTDEFVWFALTGFIIAVISPPLSRDEVDFWYYTFGIIGLVLVFNSQVILRDNLSEANSKKQYLTSLHSRIETIRLLDESLVKSITIEHKQNILHQLSGRFQDAFNNYYFYIRDVGCWEGQENTKRCKEFLKNREISLTLLEISSISEEKIAKYEYSNLSHILKAQFGILVNDILLPASSVVGVFIDGSKERSLKELHSYLRQEVVELEKIQPDEDATLNEQKMLPTNLSLKLFLSTFWPYVLCTALCLKLAKLGVLRSLIKNTS